MEDILKIAEQINESKNEEDLFDFSFAEKKEQEPETKTEKEKVFVNLDLEKYIEEQLKNPDVFEGWAKKIAVNQCLQTLRKKKEMLISIDDETFVEKHLADENSEFTFEKDILTLLNYLPEGCRTIFNLFAIEGYPHREIAEMLSISEGTSKSQVNFARKKLQELLQTQNV